MTGDELRQLVIEHLDRDGDASPWSAMPGAVLYSGVASIRPGPFYLVGMNPGGRGGAAIRDTLCAKDGTNVFVDGDWTDEPGERMRLQERVQDLMSALGVAPADTPSANMVFARSPKWSELPKGGEWLDRCWPVHQALLRRIRPAWIVMLGFGPAYYDLSRRGRTIETEMPILAAGKQVAWHRRMDLDLGEGQRLEVGVLAVAHPGDYQFNVLGMSGAHGYPAEIKVFIDQNLRAR